MSELSHKCSFQVNNFRIRVGKKGLGHIMTHSDTVSCDFVHPQEGWDKSSHGMCDLSIQTDFKLPIRDDIKSSTLICEDSFKLTPIPIPSS